MTIVEVRFPLQIHGDKTRYQFFLNFYRYKGPEDANQFCEDLVNRTGVLLLPPKIYNSELLETPQDRFCIGFGRKNIEKGLSVFRRYLLN